MQKYYIYKVTNLMNGKIYIGKTNNFTKRKLEHTRYDINNGNIFHKALKKYGESNFKWEIIDTCTGLDQINKLEKYYIKKFNSYKPNGYNMTKGGDGGSMWNARPVVCLTLDGNFVKRYNSASEAKHDGFSDSNVLQCCKNILYQSKKHLFMFEDEYLKKGPKKYIKPINKNKKSIIQCDKNGNFIQKYDSVSEAAETTGIARHRISSVLIGDSKTAGGYIFVYEKNFPINNIEKYMQRKKGIKIGKIDPTTNTIIKQYDSIAEAGRGMNVNYKSIHKVLDKPNRTAYGFKWIKMNNS